MMKIIFFGLGSIGKQHARILRDNFKHAIFAFRSDNNAKLSGLGIKEVYRWQEVRTIKPDIAFITNPTFLHIKTALKCADLGMHLFIEKPLSDSMDNILQLERICRRNKLTCYTAYCLRFHPVIMKMREILRGKPIYHARLVCSSYLPLWRKDKNWKKYYSVDKKQGGGVLLDLSHEFDYISYIFGEIDKISGVFSKVSNVTVDSEDFADILIKLESSVHVNLHLNFFSRINERSLKVDFPDGYLIGDLINNKIEFYDKGKKQVINFTTSRQKVMREQLRYFFDHLGNVKIMNGIQESKKLLAKILEFKNG